MDLEHSESNFTTLLPYLKAVEENNGTGHFKSYHHNYPELVIERTGKILFDVREYHMFLEGNNDIDLEFTAYFNSGQIIPIRLFNTQLNYLDNSNYWKTSFECFLGGNKKIPNIYALQDVDIFISKWLKDLDYKGYGRDLSQYEDEGVPVKPSETKYSETISFDGAEHTLYICKGTISCRKNNHEIIPATGILVSLDKKPVKINVNYCSSCKKYFINLTEYKYYQERYGALLGNYTFQGFTFPKGSGFDNLAEESELHLCGYNVNMAENLSSQKRRLILENIMDRNIMSKPKIIEHLEFLITTREKLKNQEKAINKWEDDLEWVREFNINNQRRFLITDVKKAY